MEEKENCKNDEKYCEEYYSFGTNWSKEWLKYNEWLIFKNCKSQCREKEDFKILQERAKGSTLYSFK